jgi:hypothetical protein
MSTYIISLWGDRNSERPNYMLGPYTKREAEHVAKNLTCPWAIRQISTVVPEWALS